MPPVKCWGKNKKSKIGENIFFGGKLPRSAWHKMRHFCVLQLHFKPSLSLFVALTFKAVFERC